MTYDLCSCALVLLFSLRSWRTPRLKISLYCYEHQVSSVEHRESSIKHRYKEYNIRNPYDIVTLSLLKRAFISQIFDQINILKKITIITITIRDNFLDDMKNIKYN